MRTRHDAEARRHAVEQWQRSGLGAKEFAGQAGVCYSTLYKWRRELGNGAAFVEVVPREAASAPRPVAPSIDAAVEIALPTGVVVRIARDVDQAMVRRVVLALV